MADDNGNSPFRNGGGTAPIASGITEIDDIIRIDPGAIDAGTETPSVGSKPGYGPNGRKLNKDGTERAARGTGSGQGRTRAYTSNPQATLPVEALAGTIMGLHALMSATLKIPELALDPREGAQLAGALANLQKFYPVAVTEKALAWGNVLTAVGMIYGTRVAAIGARRAAERRGQPHAPQSATVLRPNFRPAPTAPAQGAPPAPTPNITTPDGDPVQGQTPGAQPRNSSEAVFASIPPELM